MFYFDPLYLLFMAPVLLFTLYAQYKVKASFKKYSKVVPASGVSGAAASRALLDAAGLSAVAVQETPGSLSDHYDPRAKVLNLSQEVYNGVSLAAVGVAAHEAGHAMQDARGYVPMRLRSGLVPVANLGSQMALPLFFLGFLLSGWINSSIGAFVINIAIIIFAAAVLFQIVTLPVELNASRRAMAALTESAVISPEEYKPTRSVLGAAALTYVAAAATALMTLLYMIIRSRDD